MEKINELRMSLVILLVGLFFISGCFFEKNYEVTFKTNGGSKVANLEVKAGAKLDDVEEPVKEGYKFLGWYFDGEKFDFDTKIDEDITLVAKWEKEEIKFIEEEEETTTTTTTKKKTTKKKTTKKKTTAKKTTTKKEESTTKETTTSTTTTTTTTTTSTTSTSTPVTVQITTSAEVTTRPVVDPNPDQDPDLTPDEPSQEEEVKYANFRIDSITSQDDKGTPELEDDIVTYDLVIDFNLEEKESNVELNIEELDYQALINSDKKNWSFYSNNGFTFENTFDVNLTEISKFDLKGDSKVITSVTLYDGNKYYILDYDEFLQKWYLKYPAVTLSYGLDVKYYNNIYTALANAQDDYMITLLSDLNIDQSLNIDKFITIDFNNKNVESVADNFMIIKDLNNADKDLVIKNLNAKVKSFMYFESNVVAKSVILEKSVITYDGIFKNDTENILINLVETSFSGIL